MMSVRSKIKTIFGQRVPDEYINALQDLEEAESCLESAKSVESVTTGDFARINACKARLYDMLISDGYVIIGKVKP